MKKRIAAVIFVTCVVTLLMLTASFEQTDKLSAALYIALAALSLAGAYISGTAAGIKNNACRTEKSDKR